MVLTSVIYSFVYGVILGHFYKHTTLSASFRICLLIIMLPAYSVIAIELLYKTNTQEELIRKFSITDRLFSNDLNISIPTKGKLELFVLNIIVIFRIV